MSFLSFRLGGTRKDTTLPTACASVCTECAFALPVSERRVAQQKRHAGSACFVTGRAGVAINPDTGGALCGAGKAARQPAVLARVHCRRSGKSCGHLRSGESGRAAATTAAGARFVLELAGRRRAFWACFCPGMYFRGKKIGLSSQSRAWQESYPYITWKRSVPGIQKKRLAQLPASGVVTRLLYGKHRDALQPLPANLLYAVYVRTYTLPSEVVATAVLRAARLFSVQYRHYSDGYFQQELRAF
ncbi:hypothetical protein MRX96_018928 [Rhipicephalus microplus]